MPPPLGARGFAGVHIVFTLGWFVLYPDEPQQLGKHIAAGVGFVSNVVLWRESGCRFRPMIQPTRLGW